MLASGVVLAVFVLVHLANLTWGIWHPSFVPLAVHHNVVALFRVPRLGRLLPDRARRAGASRGARRLERAAVAGPHTRARRTGVAAPRPRRGDRPRHRPLRRGGRGARRSRAMNVGASARRAHPGRPARVEVGRVQGRRAAGQPGQPAPLQRHRRRLRPCGRLGRRLAGRARLRRDLFLLPGQPAARAQHRRSGRHQRRQELPERRRQRLPPVPRHDQGRRLPLARGQRLSPGAAVLEHHRPVRRAGRAVRARVRRLAGQPLVRWRAGRAHVLRARADRAAAAARRVSGAGAPGRARTLPRCSRAARCSTWW